MRSWIGVPFSLIALQAKDCSEWPALKARTGTNELLQLQATVVSLHRRLPRFRMLELHACKHLQGTGCSIDVWQSESLYAVVHWQNAWLLEQYWEILGGDLWALPAPNEAGGSEEDSLARILGIYCGSIRKAEGRIGRMSWQNTLQWRSGGSCYPMYPNMVCLRPSSKCIHARWHGSLW